MSKVYLTVEYDTNLLFEKINGIIMKANELENDMREFRKLCGQAAAKTAAPEDTEPKKDN